jgi:predicted DNA-binding ribbon-helix-helix protein
VSLERPFWDAFKEIATAKNATLTALILEIESNRKHANLSSVIRLFVLDYYREPAERDHGKAQ